MSDTMRRALMFLIDTLFNLYLFILVVRLVLAWVRSDYFNPVTQFVVKMTDIFVRPLRRIFPNIKNLETATLVLILVIEMVKFFLITFISYGFPNLLGLPILASADLLYLILQTFTYAIILQAILSFVQPASPLLHVLYRFSSPIMRPIQRLVPPVGGIDLSPIPALIILQLMGIVLVTPLMALGQGITLG